MINYVIVGANRFEDAVAFDVDSPDKVDALHARVLALGGTSEGEPGARGQGMYAAYWRDLDGDKFNFICYPP